MLRRSVQKMLWEEMMMIRILSEKENIIVKHHSAGYREYRIPGILPVKKALLLTFEARCGEGEENIGDWGDIDILVLRKEEGKEPEEVLKIGESHLPKTGKMRTYNNPVLIPDEDRIHLIYHKNYEQVYIVTSGDEGRTWTEPKEITADYRKTSYEWNVSATGPGHGIRMDNGRLVAPVWFANGKVHEDGMRRDHAPSISGCVYSDDHGETWKVGEPVHGMTNGSETCAAVLPEGKILFNYRNEEKDKHRRLAISSDGGETIDCLWKAEELQDPICCGGMTSCEGRIWFVNCNNADSRTCLTVKCSQDEGIHWESVWNADTFGGYADIAVRKNKIYVFYERHSYDLGLIRELVLKEGSLIDETV